MKRRTFLAAALALLASPWVAQASPTPNGSTSNGTVTSSRGYLLGLAFAFFAIGGLANGDWQTLAMNYSVNTSSGYVRPTTAADTYGQASAPSLTTDSSGQGGVTRRELFKTAGLGSSAGDKVRITLTPPTSGNTVISNAFIGHAGTAPNFDGTQIRLTFNGGSNSVTLTGGGSAVVSDPITYSFDHTKDFIVALDITGTSSLRYNASAGANFVDYYKSGDSANVGSTSVTGYSSVSSEAAVVSKIEIRTAIGSTNNMTVVTTSQTADAAVSNVRVLMEIDPIDSITLNTDLTAEVTCDGGSNWASGTLSSVGKGQGGRTIVETADTSCGANTGTSFAARIKTLNNKSVNIYETAVTAH